MFKRDCSWAHVSYGVIWLCIWLIFSVLSADTPSEYRNRGELDGDGGVRKACRFSKTHLGSCSGVDDDTYGFQDGRPCLIVKLNRIVMFRPRVCTPTPPLVMSITSLLPKTPGTQRLKANVILTKRAVLWFHLQQFRCVRREISLRTTWQMTILLIDQCVYFQPPTNNGTIPAAAQSRLQPNMIPIHCTNKVHFTWQCQADYAYMLPYYGHTATLQANWYKCHV